jgi:hypothetical protein
MSGDLSVVEKSVEDIIIDLMDEMVISTEFQASSTRGVKASPLSARRSGPSQAATKNISKHHDDLANTNLIQSVLPDYILPLVGAVSHDSVSRDFDYTLIIGYLSKGIRTVKPHLERILMLKINDFSLGDCKNYGMLTPHKYLTKTMGKNSKIIPQPWTMDIARSTILNVMNIPHFDRHQEVNVCVKILMSCYHGGYLWLDRCNIVDPTLIHWITGLSMQGLDPQDFYLGKDADRTLAH